MGHGNEQNKQVSWHHNSYILEERDKQYANKFKIYNKILGHDWCYKNKNIEFKRDSDWVEHIRYISFVSGILLTISHIITL